MNVVLSNMRSKIENKEFLSAKEFSTLIRMLRSQQQYGAQVEEFYPLIAMYIGEFLPKFKDDADLIITHALDQVDGTSPLERFYEEAYSKKTRSLR